MRLFFGLDFSEATKELLAVQEQILKISAKGALTKKENFHLTLLFLGEVDLDRCLLLAGFLKQEEPLQLQLSQPGLFRSRRGNIVWQGLKENKSLRQLAFRLASQAQSLGLILRIEDFTPHITLLKGQEFLPGFSLQDLPDFFNEATFEFSHINLYESIPEPKGVYYRVCQSFKLKPAL